MKFFLPVAISVFLMASCISEKNEKILISDSFENYQSAILNKKGEEAINYLSNSSIEYYSNILDKIKNADSLEICSFEITDKILILLFRQVVRKDQILSFEGGEDLLVFAINEGFLGQHGASTLSIENVVVEGEIAETDLLSDGVKQPFVLELNKENGIWKVDLMSIIAMSADPINNYIIESGLSESEFIIQALKTVSDREVSSVIWDKIQ